MQGLPRPAPPQGCHTCMRPGVNAGAPLLHTIQGRRFGTPCSSMQLEHTGAAVAGCFGCCAPCSCASRGPWLSVHLAHHRVTCGPLHAPCLSRSHVDQPHVGLRVDHCMCPMWTRYMCPMWACVWTVHVDLHVDAVQVGRCMWTRYMRPTACCPAAALPSHAAGAACTRTQARSVKGGATGAAKQVKRWHTGMCNSALIATPTATHDTVASLPWMAAGAVPISLQRSQCQLQRYHCSQWVQARHPLQCSRWVQASHPLQCSKR